ncbi:uncharacterized protein LOC116177427 [Photinus pyralis]|uniref:uncharacterized protein LOC116177427 n=1 Tax=Photinus pyralis TaxID=7054 RepID=UPI0012670220|nr:uncharacterized protein LOC116177427 [Photinus pyralis]
MGKRRRKSPVSRIDVKRRRLLRKLDKLDRASGLHKESSCSSDTADTRSERGSTPMESNSDYGHFEDLIHEDSIAFSEQGTVAVSCIGEVDGWLFGVNLDERVKASKNLERVSRDVTLDRLKLKHQLPTRRQKTSQVGLILITIEFGGTANI